MGLNRDVVGSLALERIRGICALVLIAALIVYYPIADAWPERAAQWLRRPGGKVGLASDRDGYYVLLDGIRAVVVTNATLTFATEHAFPR